MLITLLLIILLKSVCFNAEKNYFITSDFNNNFFCATNTSYALAWNSDNDEETQSSVFQNVTQQNFNCKINKNAIDSCLYTYWLKGPWTLENSLIQNLDEIIQDRRWEDFELTNKTSIVFNASNLHIPISYRKIKETFFFSNNKMSVYVRWFNGLWFFKKIGELENKHYWQHSLIKVEENTIISLLKFKKNKFKTLETVNMSGYQLDSIFIKNALFKIHSYDYLYTNKSSNNLVLGNTITVNNKFVCISMFIRNCGKCRFLLSLKNVKTEKIYNIQRFHSKSKKWKEIRFVTDNIFTSNDDVVLMVSTKSFSKSKNFWAIDDVQLCSKQNIRSIYYHGKEKLNCQLISYEDTIEINTKSDSIIINEYHKTLIIILGSILLLITFGIFGCLCYRCFLKTFTQNSENENKNTFRCITPAPAPCVPPRDNIYEELINFKTDDRYEVPFDFTKITQKQLQTSELQNCVESQNLQHNSYIEVIEPPQPENFTEEPSNDSNLYSEANEYCRENLYANFILLNKK